MTAASGGEPVDVVDELDGVIEVTTRARMRAEGLRHRAVYLLVWSSRGELLVHRRSFDKDLAPGWWDIAIGGVVAAGEHYDEAAVRELAEEIGITDADPQVLGDGRFDGEVPGAGPLRVIGRVYRVTHDGPFTFADGEVIAAEWLAPDRLAAVVAERPFCVDSLALCGPYLPGPAIG